MSYFDKFASHGLSIPLITTPGNFLDPDHDETKRVYAACEEAGVENIKIGYWQWNSDDGGYWTKVDQYRKKLEAFEKLSDTLNLRFKFIKKNLASKGSNNIESLFVQAAVSYE